ncbi:hypothetical protein M0R45_033638 [Rubus argutus]|uniref:Uncharacterized protein n=1 Tax=Rubus argutus TaxID=59490 RepID=A0AAW1WK68_RUBAR
MGHESPTPVPRKHRDGQSSDSCSSSDGGGGGPINIRPKKSRYPVEDDDGAAIGMIGSSAPASTAVHAAACRGWWRGGCLGLGKNGNKSNGQGQNWNSKQKCKKKQTQQSQTSHRHQRCAVEEELPAQISCCALDFDQEGDEEEVDDCVSSAERVWLELYQVGHLGFGRVSFTGLQSVPLGLGKADLGT